MIEDGAVVFDLGQAKYSVSGESNKCLLHLWSHERNVVRRVLDVESKGETLRVTVQRMGQARPTKLDICRERDPRTASAKRAARMAYQRVCQHGQRTQPGTNAQREPTCSPTQQPRRDNGHPGGKERNDDQFHAMRTQEFNI